MERPMTKLNRTILISVAAVMGAAFTRASKDACRDML